MKDKFITCTLLVVDTTSFDQLIMCKLERTHDIITPLWHTKKD